VLYRWRQYDHSRCRRTRRTRSIYGNSSNNQIRGTARISMACAQSHSSSNQCKTAAASRRALSIRGAQWSLCGGETTRRRRIHPRNKQRDRDGLRKDINAGITLQMHTYLHSKESGNKVSRRRTSATAQTSERRVTCSTSCRTSRRVYHKYHHREKCIRCLPVYQTFGNGEAHKQTTITIRVSCGSSINDNVVVMW
jgi:hypothetical protein